MSENVTSIITILLCSLGIIILIGVLAVVDLVKKNKQYFRKKEPLQ